MDLKQSFDQNIGRIDYDTKHWRIGDFIYGITEELIIADNRCLNV